MKKKKCHLIMPKLLLTLCYWLVCSSLVAQSNTDIVVPLTRVMGIGPLYTNIKAIYKKTDKAKDFLGTPTDFPQFAIFKIELNTDQVLFDKF